MAPVQARIAVLAEHGARLRKLGVVSLVFGFAALTLACLVVWPDPGATGVLVRSRLLAAPELASVLEAAGVGVFPSPANFMAPADQSSRLNLVLMLMVLCGVWPLTRKWPLMARLALIGGSWPFVLSLIANTTTDRARLPTVAVEMISDRAGAPLPEAAARRNSPRVAGRPQLQYAYHLQPGWLSGALSDQAHFVLAQRAYHDARPADVAGHLRALTGAWRPSPEVALTILGVLDAYARAHQEDPGRLAHQLAGGRPHYRLRHEGAAWSVRLAALLGILGATLFVVGARRGHSAQRLQRASVGLATQQGQVGVVLSLHSGGQ